MDGGVANRSPGKLDKDTVRYLREICMDDDGEPRYAHEIIEETGIDLSAAALRRILAGETWTWLDKDDPVEIERRKKWRRRGRKFGGGCVLTVDVVRKIKERLARGESCTVIGRAFGVSETSIRGIRDGRNWKHVK
jgi:hypothetical protein